MNPHCLGDGSDLNVARIGDGPVLMSGLAARYLQAPVYDARVLRRQPHPRCKPPELPSTIVYQALRGRLLLLKP